VVVVIGRLGLLTALVLAPTVALTGCTSGSGPAGPTPTITSTQTLTRPPSVIPTAPIVAGPTTSTRATCPYLSLADAANLLGQRIDHSVVLTSAKKTVGCQFFDVTGEFAGPTAENLPPPTQASIEIRTAVYPSADSVHNALARLAGAGAQPEQVTVTPNLVGELFQTNFYAADHGQDWACAFIKGTTLVTVLTANNVNQLSTQQIANTVGPRI
jgi:hypothetical protein